MATTTKVDFNPSSTVALRQGKPWKHVAVKHRSWQYGSGQLLSFAANRADFYWLRRCYSCSWFRQTKAIKHAGNQFLFWYCISHVLEYVCVFKHRFLFFYNCFYISWWFSRFGAELYPALDLGYISIASANASANRIQGYLLWQWVGNKKSLFIICIDMFKGRANKLFDNAAA